MLKVLAKANEIKQEISSQVAASQIRIDENVIEVDIKKDAVEAKGQIEKDLSELKGAVRKEIEDIVGYDVEFAVLVNVTQR